MSLRFKTWSRVSAGAFLFLSTILQNKVSFLLLTEPTPRWMSAFDWNLCCSRHRKEKQAQAAQKVADKSIFLLPLLSSFKAKESSSFLRPNKRKLFTLSTLHSFFTVRPEIAFPSSSPWAINRYSSEKDPHKSCERPKGNKIKLSSRYWFNYAEYDCLLISGRNHSAESLWNQRTSDASIAN